MDKVKRYEFTYTNSFKDKYSADRELDPDGDYVLHADFAKLEAVKDGWKRLAKAYKEFSEALEADNDESWVVDVTKYQSAAESAEQHLRSLGELP